MQTYDLTMHITQDSGAIMHLISSNLPQLGNSGAVMHLISSNLPQLGNSGAVMHLVSCNLPILYKQKKAAVAAF
jgi:hypothetical protein